MSTRKQTTKSRSYTNGFNFQANAIQKQNESTKRYDLDPKIVELKKKYLVEKNQNSLSYESSYRPTACGFRQQEVLRKLQNIKSQLETIPDWKQHARSILFDESIPNSKSKMLFKHLDTSKNTATGHHSRFGSDYLQKNESNKILDNSGVSFKINHTTSIEKLDRKPRFNLKQEETPPPVKTISEFKFSKDKYEKYDKYERYQKKDKTFEFEGKNNQFDEKISEISRKIKQSQNKKRILGVDFVPFQRKSVSKYENDKTHHDQSKMFRSPTPQYLLLKKNTTSTQKLYARPPKPAVTLQYNELLNNSKVIKQEFESVSPRFAPINDYAIDTKKYQKGFKNQIYKQETQQQKQLANIKKNRSYSVYQKPNKAISIETIMQTSKDSKVLLERAQQAIKQRKRKVGTVEQTKKKKQNTLKFVQAFCQQVKLDEKFRNCKLWLKSCRNEKKMQKIKNLLNMQGIKLTQAKILEQFSVLQKQDNPFFSVTSQNCDLQQVVRSYVQCQKYWKKNLYKKFSKSALESEDFNSSSIDLDKKGYFMLEDLVRFLNMETGTFFRNRDLFTIFRRLGSNQKLDFNTFCNTFYV